jgi:hypothetical protein
MQNKEFDKLVESFLKPKTKLEDNASFSLASLLSLVEEVEKIQQTINEQQTPTATVGPVLISSERKEFEREALSVELFYKLFQGVLAKNINIDSAQQPEEKIKLLIKAINELKTGNQTTKSLSDAFSIILFVASLNNMIWNIAPDEPAAAGNYFEKFIAFLLGGAFDASKKTIYDISIGNEHFISLKLLGEFRIAGSIPNMLNFLEVDPLDPNPQSTKQITYIVAIKNVKESSLRFYSYKFNGVEFLNAIKQQTEAYEKYIEKLNVDDQIKTIMLSVGLNPRAGIEDYNKLIVDMTKKLEGYNSEINFAVGSDDSATVQKLENEKDQLEEEYKRIVLQYKKLEDLSTRKKVLSADSVTQFKFNQQQFDAITTNSANKILKGGAEDTLGMTSKEEALIISTNQSIFNESITQIIEESKVVQYKVNNFLLSKPNQRKVTAESALESVKNLKTNLEKQK